MLLNDVNRHKDKHSLPYQIGHELDVVIIPLKGKRVFDQIARLGDLHFVQKFPDFCVGFTLD